MTAVPEARCGHAIHVDCSPEEACVCCFAKRYRSVQQTNAESDGSGNIEFKVRGLLHVSLTVDRMAHFFQGV